MRESVTGGSCKRVNSNICFTIRGKVNVVIFFSLYNVVVIGLALMIIAALLGNIW
jgi:hypothetical protein